MAEDVGLASEQRAEGVVLKYFRHHIAQWDECDSIEAAVRQAYWMIEDVAGSPTEIVTFYGEVLLAEDELQGAISRHGESLPAVVDAVPAPPIADHDKAAAAAFSTFMDIRVPRPSDWAGLSEPVKEFWRAKASVAADRGG